MAEILFPMLNTLHADGPALDRTAAMMLYGRFVGSWDGTFACRNTTGERRETSAEVHFGWVLAGRAVQDVWIVPSRDARRPAEPEVMHGTTLRIYDPKRDAWEITWLDPVKQVCNRMVGRQVGDDIIQEYRADDGKRCQWTFTEITPNSFHWTNRESADEGATWNVRAEFFLRRRA